MANSENLRYRSSYNGNQIDQAYEAISDIVNPSEIKKRIVYIGENVGSNKGGVKFQATNFTYEQIAMKPTNVGTTRSGNFVSVDSNGNILASDYNDNSFIPAITTSVTDGNLAKLVNDGSGITIQDAGVNANYIAQLVSELSAFEPRIESAENLSRSALQISQSTQSEFYSFQLETDERFSDVQNTLESMAVSYEQVEEPDYGPDEGILYAYDRSTSTDLGQFYAVGPDEAASVQQAIEDMLAQVPPATQNEIIEYLNDNGYLVTGYTGVIDPNLIYAKFYSFNSPDERVALVDALSIPKPKDENWEAYKNKFPVWTSQGTLKNSGIGPAQIAELISQVTNLQNRVHDLEQEIVRLYSVGLMYIDDPESDATTITAHDSSDPSYTGTGIHYTEDETDISVTGYTNPLVQLYSYDGSKILYPRVN